LLEYACVYLPCNHEAIVEEVSKGGIPDDLLAALGLDPQTLAREQTPPTPAPAPAAPIRFVSESEVRAAVEAALTAVDFGKFVEDQVRLLYEKHTGRV
jgi:hypothetical protein